MENENWEIEKKKTPGRSDKNRKLINTKIGNIILLVTKCYQKYV